MRGDSNRKKNHEGPSGRTEAIQTHNGQIVAGLNRVLIDGNLLGGESK